MASADSTLVPPPIPPNDNSGTPPPIADQPAKYFYVENSKPIGPLDRAAVNNLIEQGKITRTTQMWRGGSGPEWKSADSFPDFTESFPPLVDYSRRWVDFLIGTWRLEVRLEGRGQYRIAVVTYYPDKRYSGELSVYPLFFTGVSPTIASEQGTWTVQGINDSRFVVTLVQEFNPQWVPQGQTPKTEVPSMRKVGFTLIDQNTIRNEELNAFSRRIG